MNLVEPKLILTTLFIGLLTLFFSRQTLALQTTVEQLELFSLAQQIPTLKTHNIRARRITVPAGGKIEKHEHTSRAGIVYVESGEIIEYRYNNEQKQSRTLTAGETLIEDATTVHSYLNQSEQACVLIAFDLPIKAN